MKKDNQIMMKYTLLIFFGLMLVSGCSERYDSEIHNCTYWYCVYDGYTQIMGCNGSYYNISRTHFQPDYCELEWIEKPLLSAKCTAWIDKKVS